MLKRSLSGKEFLVELAVQQALKAGAEFADARLLNRQSEFIQTKNLKLAALTGGESQGIGIRILARGGWGFAASQDLSEKSIRRCAQEAYEIAKASGGCRHTPIKLVPEKPWRASWTSPHLIDPFSVELDEKLKILLDSAAAVLSVAGVTLAQGFLHFIKDHQFYANSEGALIDQLSIRSGCLVEATASGEGDQQRASYPCSFGQYEQAGFEMVERWNLVGNAAKTGKLAVDLLKAEPCPKGNIDTIIGSSQLALQIHESMGHPSELDRALLQEINFAGASFLTPDKLGALKYGSDIVNLVADATAPGALGSFGFDDEGVQAQCVDLVKAGKFQGYLSSRDTALLIGLNRSGGAMRAESWHFAPIIRMTNISLKPGQGSLEALIEDTKDGLYLETNRSWSIDSMRYNFQFSTEVGYEIKNGKIGRMFKNPSYSGITPEFWNSCDAICGETEYVHWGTPNCGKGQPMQTMWTGHGASPARFRKLSVGIAQSGGH
ncbi:MAG: TldD/PmbA family protein [Candidatus Obscuribacterales bacterium]|nr:TldD/PmbA family protein [Candidatus Obscuribacterales bacterium]